MEYPPVEHDDTHIFFRLGMTFIFQTSEDCDIFWSILKHNIIPSNVWLCYVIHGDTVFNNFKGYIYGEVYQLQPIFIIHEHGAHYANVYPETWNLLTLSSVEYIGNFQTYVRFNLPDKFYHQEIFGQHLNVNLFLGNCER